MSAAKKDSLRRALWARDWTLAAALVERREGHLFVGEDGRSALSTALLKHAPATVVRGLLEAKLDPCATDKGGHTCLHSAVAGNVEAEILVALLRAGAAKQLDHHDLVTGDTALTMAAQVGTSEELVRVLLDYGADPSLLGAEGKTAAQWARDEGNEAVAALLNNPPKPTHGHLQERIQPTHPVAFGRGKAAPSAPSTPPPSAAAVTSAPEAQVPTIPSETVVLAKVNLAAVGKWLAAHGGDVDGSLAALLAAQRAQEPLDARAVYDQLVARGDTAGDAERILLDLWEVLLHAQQCDDGAPAASTPPPQAGTPPPRPPIRMPPPPRLRITALLVQQQIDSIRAGRYAGTLLQHGYDFPRKLLLLDGYDLDSMGIVDAGDRSKILAIKTRAQTVAAN